MLLAPSDLDEDPCKLDAGIISSPRAEPPVIPTSAEKISPTSARKVRVSVLAAPVPQANDLFPTSPDATASSKRLGAPEANDLFPASPDTSPATGKRVSWAVTCQSVAIDDYTLPGQMQSEVQIEPIRSSTWDSEDSLVADAAGTNGLFSDIRDLKAAPSVRDVKRGERSRLTVADLYYKQDGSMLSKVASSRKFEYLTLTIISLNGMWIGIDTDHNTDWTTWPMTVFLVADNLFCVYFTAEVIIRFCAFARKLDCLKDGWFKFDSVLVTLMVGETWVMPFIGGGSGGMGNLSILRLLRLLRLTRMAKLMSAVPELLTLVKGMIASIRSVGSTLVLLIVFIYVFAIIFTGQYKESEDEALRAYFGSMGVSMFTLFINGTILDDLSSVVAALLTDSQVMLWVLIVFILLSSFTMLNMLIGILCEVVSATAEYEKSKMAINAANDVLTEFFTEIDADGSGKVSKDEWLQMAKNERVMKALAGLGIEEDHIKRIVLVVFTQEDGDGERELDFDDFLEELLRIKPSASANSLEAMHLLKTMQTQTRGLQDAMGIVLEKLDSRIGRLSLPGKNLPDNGEEDQMLDSKQRRKLQQKQKPQSVRRMNLKHFSNEDIIAELRKRGRKSKRTDEVKSPKSAASPSDVGFPAGTVRLKLPGCPES